MSKEKDTILVLRKACLSLVKKFSENCLDTEFSPNPALVEMSLKHITAHHRCPTFYPCQSSVMCVCLSYPACAKITWRSFCIHCFVLDTFWQQLSVELQVQQQQQQCTLLSCSSGTAGTAVTVNWVCEPENNDGQGSPLTTVVGCTCQQFYPTWQRLKKGGKKSRPQTFRSFPIPASPSAQGHGGPPELPTHVRGWRRDDTLDTSPVCGRANRLRFHSSFSTKQDAFQKGTKTQLNCSLQVFSLNSVQHTSHNSCEISLLELEAQNILRFWLDLMALLLPLLKMKGVFYLSDI